MPNDAGVPVMPHREIANCRQCHVAQQVVKPFRKNRFQGGGDPVRVARPSSGAPPVMPHRAFMREKCLACHGKESRGDIVHSPHPDRVRCQQCHVEQRFDASWRSR